MIRLQAVVLDSIGSPVSNATVLFSAPVSGPSGTFADTDTYTTTAPTTESGIATAVPFTANGLTGTLTVTATAGGTVTPTKFLLGNLGWYVTSTGNDDNSCLSPGETCATINGAQSKSDIGRVSGDTILVAAGTFIGPGGQVVLINKNVKLSGGWNSAFITRTSLSTIDGQGMRGGVKVDSGVTAVIERFTVRNGLTGGVHNLGILTINNSTVTSNTASANGSGIFNEGTLTLNSSRVSNNNGVGIYNPCCDSTLKLNNSTVNGNTGVGIHADGKTILNNSTVSGNSDTGIYGYYGAVTLNNSTVSNNTGNESGGLALQSVATLRNSIVAGNRPADCSGSISSAGYNLIGKQAWNCTVVMTTGDLIDVNPQLFPLIGSPAYHPLLPWSPAINAGNPTGCTDDQNLPLDADQRGIARVGRCDIGAYEYDSDHDPLKYIFLPTVLRK